MRQNRWYVNTDGFNNDEEFRPDPHACVALGDSVLYGGNPVSYPDRVGTLASHITHHPVWVGAAGGWSLLNELAFARAHRRQISEAGHLTLFLNNGDFGALTPWTDELAFPTKRPLFALPYLVRRYALPHSNEMPPIIEDEAQEDVRAWKAGLADLIATYPHRISVILYANQADFANGATWAKDIASFRRYAARYGDRIRIYDARRVWRPSLYRDGAHPNDVGNMMLAEILANSCG